jgi:hypothetical protein
MLSAYVCPIQLNVSVAIDPTSTCSAHANGAWAGRCHSDRPRSREVVLHQPEPRQAR